MSTAAAPHDSPRAPRPLPLVAELARALEKAEIAYCHWKSNAELAPSLSGGNDRDRLVLGADSGP